MNVPLWTPESDDSDEGETMNEDWHIVSLIAYCRPGRFAQFRQRIGELSFAEHHADDNHAKLIITIEGETTSEIANGMDILRDDPDLMTLQMVYHQDDSIQSLSSEETL